MVSSECRGLAQSHYSCACVASCPCLCVPDCLDLEFLLCNMALLWAVGSEQGLGPPEMESVLSTPPPTGVHRREGGRGACWLKLKASKSTLQVLI